MYFSPLYARGARQPGRPYRPRRQAMVGAALMQVTSQLWVPVSLQQLRPKLGLFLSWSKRATWHPSRTFWMAALFTLQRVLLAKFLGKTAFSYTLCPMRLDSVYPLTVVVARRRRFFFLSKPKRYLVKRWFSLITSVTFNLHAINMLTARRWFMPLSRLALNLASR